MREYKKNTKIELGELAKAEDFETLASVIRLLVKQAVKRGYIRRQQ